jgi:putative NIF3 family GTP cyclohydrolase 1 type 2
MTTLKEYLTVERIAQENGVNFTMEVYKTEDGYYRSYGYAMVNGVKVADWQHYETEKTEAYSQETKDYLIRELRPMVRQQLIFMKQTAERFLSNYHA